MQWFATRPATVIACTAGLLACATVQRRERTDLTFTAGRNQAEVADFGCGGGPFAVERHTQSSGAIGIRTESASFLAAELQTGVVQSEVTAVAGDTSARPGQRFLMWAVRGLVGADAGLVGIDVGATMWMSTSDYALRPLVALRAGKVDQLWLEARLGSRDVIADPNIIGVFANYRYGERFGVAVGLSTMERIAPGQLWRSSELDNNWSDAVLVQGWVDLGPGAVQVSAAIGEQPGFTVGFRLPLHIGPAAALPAPSTDGYAY
jgi:hypothetical protein